MSSKKMFSTKTWFIGSGKKFYEPKKKRTCIIEYDNLQNLGHNQIPHL